MFTTKCFIRKNTPELRDKLAKLGYHICSCCKFKDNIWLHNFINDESARYEIHGIGAWDVEDNQEEVLNLYIIGNSEHPNPAIDCGDNEELFLAIAALRDDKIPDHQWFVWDDNEDEGDKFKQYIPGEPWQDWWWFEVHKASVNELLEHFKD